MPRDVATRWNSMYDMLVFVIKYRVVVDAICADRELSLRKFELTTREWAITSQLADTLKVRVQTLTPRCPGSDHTRSCHLTSRLLPYHLSPRSISKSCKPLWALYFLRNISRATEVTKVLNDLHQSSVVFLVHFNIFIFSAKASVSSDFCDLCSLCGREYRAPRVLLPSGTGNQNSGRTLVARSCDP